MKSSDVQCYPVFETNQILTSTQLNRLREFLDQENRISRLDIAGSGIISGLEAEFISSNNVLSVKKGYGITSDGFFIINENELLLKRYKKYVLPEGDTYEPFFKNEKLIDIYELFPDNTKVEGTKQISALTKAELGKKVVLLFLEFYDESLSTCTGSDCDNKGKRRSCFVKVLLVNQTDLPKVDLNDYLKEGDGLQTIVLPTLASSISTKLQEITSVNEIHNGYVKIVGEYRKIVSEALLAAHKKYAKYFGLEDLDTDPLAKLKTLTYDKKISQYAYDFIRDLILAYNEFRETANYVYRQAVFNKPVFPRHLMLGKVFPNSGSTTEEYRNYFINTPFKDDLDNKIMKAQILFKRILMMIKSFNPGLMLKEKIKITPNTIYPPLSVEAIPYYYQNAGKIFDLWNAELEIKKRSKENLSYSENQYNTSPVYPFVKDPLNFRYDDKAFYRIEGHLGINYQDVVKKLEDYKRVYNLDFKVTALQANSSAADIVLRKDCYLGEYQSAYAELREEYFCLIDGAVKAVEYIGEKAGGGNITEYLLKLKKILPYCITELNRESYGSHLKELFAKIIEYYCAIKYARDKFIIERYDKLLYYEFDRRLKIYDNILDAISALIFTCLHKRIAAVIYSFAGAAEIYRKNHLSIFSNFVNKYPGPEHIAGVMKGGTFIIVYDDKNNDKVYADFALYSNCCCGCCEEDLCKEAVRPPFAEPYVAETVVGKNIDIRINASDDLIQNKDVKLVKITPSEGRLSFDEKNISFIYKADKEFRGYDLFEYVIRDGASKIESSAFVAVCVHEEYRQKECSLPDITITALLEKPILADFSKLGVEGTVNFNYDPKWIEAVKPEQNSALLFRIYPNGIFWEKGYYQFEYSAFETAAGKICTAKIILTTQQASPGKNIVEGRDSLTAVLDTAGNKTAIETDAALKNNVDRVKNYYAELEASMNTNPDALITGSANPQIVESTKKVIDPIVSEIKKIDKEISKTGETPELAAKKEINLKLLTSATNAFLNTVALNDKDIAANSKAAIYLNNDLGTKINDLEAGSTGLVTSKINVAASSDKTNLTAIVSKLGKQ